MKCMYLIAFWNLVEVILLCASASDENLRVFSFSLLFWLVIWS
jgi:hypothetical protein